MTISRSVLTHAETVTVAAHNPIAGELSIVYAQSALINISAYDSIVETSMKGNIYVSAHNATTRSSWPIASIRRYIQTGAVPRAVEWNGIIADLNGAGVPVAFTNRCTVDSATGVLYFPNDNEGGIIFPCPVGYWLLQDFVGGPIRAMPGDQFKVMYPAALGS